MWFGFEEPLASMQLLNGFNSVAIVEGELIISGMTALTELKGFSSLTTLNGDIDNYLALKERFEEETGRKVSDRITTDAKVIALWVDWYLRQGDDLETAFRRADVIKPTYEWSLSVEVCRNGRHGCRRGGRHAGSESACC